MRRSRRKFSSSSVGLIQPLGITSRGWLLLGILLAGVWVAWSLEQEIVLSWQLHQEASQLSQQNTALAASNADYRRDIQSVTSGMVAEEEARLRGYARAGEKVYLISNQLMEDSKSAPNKPTDSSTWARLWRWLNSD